MAEQTVDVRYVKSPQWRAVTATGAGVNAIGGLSGLEVHLRFTYEWTDVELERFQAEVTPDGKGGSTYVTKGLPQVVQTPFYKIEEVAIRMPYEAAVSLTVALMTTFSQLTGPNKLSEQHYQRIQEAIGTLSTSHSH
jgi:hypothetical protein